jgi:hypothetical protein
MRLNGGKPVGGRRAKQTQSPASLDTTGARLTVQAKDD